MTRRLGAITQFSYVVDDLDKAIEHWAGVLQVGPFFVLEHVEYKECIYKEQPCALDMSVALAYSKDIQIELVVQHNEVASIFTDFRSIRGTGLQHVGVISHDLTSDLESLSEKGIVPVQYGEAENGTRFAYLNSDTIPGTMLELFQVPDTIGSAFEYMRRAAQQWDPEIGPPRR